MGMTWMDAFERHEHDKAERLKRFPVCYSCGEHITGDYRWRIDGQVYCEDCAVDLFQEYNEEEITEGDFDDG